VRLVAAPEQAREADDQLIKVLFTVSSEENSAFSISEESRFIFPLR
jgi:hypothetical protein